MDLKQLFCKHHYVEVDEIPCTCKLLDNKTIKQCPVTLLQCEKCGKRHVIKDEDIYYNVNLLKKLKLWVKGLYNFEHFVAPKPNLRRIK